MKLLTILSNGFEDLECIGTLALCRRAGIQADIYTLHDTQAIGKYNTPLTSVDTLTNADLSTYDALFIPGGPHYEELENSEVVKNVITYFMEHGKVVAAICAAPTILGHMGYLKNKHYTCYTEMNEDFGGTFHDEHSVTDGNLVTGRAAAGTIDFAFALIEVLGGKELADAIKEEVYY
ncbi:MAG: DJ-1/PfpI family protein [Erysipelotrichales bacterium]|nr:DJ-1/PfpI family protein [Erysipelotrichales bacterium]